MDLTEWNKWWEEMGCHSMLGRFYDEEIFKMYIVGRTWSDWYGFFEKFCGKT